MEHKNTKENESELYKLIGKLQKKEVKLSYSSLKRFYENPRSFINYKLQDYNRTPSMIFGSLLDCLILTPEEFENNFTILDTVPSTDNQIGFVEDILKGLSKEESFKNNYKRGDVDKVYNSLEKFIDCKLNSKEPISNSDFDKALKIKESVLKNPVALSFLERASTIQEKIEWDYKGYRFSGFLDVRGDGFIMDLKYKGQSSFLDDFQWDFKKLHYDLQAGMYVEALRQLDIEDDPKYYIMVYDNKGDVSVIEIDFSYISHGRQKMDFCIQEMERCRIENKWLSSHDFYGDEQGIYKLIKPKFATLKGSLKR